MTNPNEQLSSRNTELAHVTFLGRGDFSAGWDKRLDQDGIPVDPIERSRFEPVQNIDSVAVKSMAEYIKHTQDNQQSA